MGSMKDRLLSRKFLMALLTFALAVFYAVTGQEVSANEVADAIAKAGGALAPIVWIIVEGWVDKSGAAAGVQSNVARYDVALQTIKAENARLAQQVQLLSQPPVQTGQPDLFSSERSLDH